MIPSYNHAPFVRQAISSVLDQDTDGVEIVVVDDASTDRSLDVIREFRSDRLQLTELPRNVGVSAALNAAFVASHGEYIAVLGSDDFFLPGALRTQADFLESHPEYDAVFGMPRLVTDLGVPLCEGYRGFTNPFAGMEPNRLDWLRRLFLKGNCLCHPTAMLRRRVHETVGLYDRQASEHQ